MPKVNTMYLRGALLGGALLQPPLKIIAPSTYFSILSSALCPDPVLDCAMGNNAPHASFVARHKPSLLVLTSQVSAAFIHGIVKILETGERPVHPFQILQVRLLITGISCVLYLWYNGLSDSLLGPKDVRPLLVVRAIGGVCGAIGFYCTYLSWWPRNSSPRLRDC